MSVFDLQRSLRDAERRLGGKGPFPRRRRSDAGKSRVSVAVVAHLRDLLLGRERPAMRHVLTDLETLCARDGLRCPSRATVYKLMGQLDGHPYRVEELPEQVRAALYNLAPDGDIPGRQLAFYCFNYGGLDAMTFAAGLPWLDLYQAGRMRGWRPKSRGLLDAAVRVRRR